MQILLKKKRLRKLGCHSNIIVNVYATAAVLKLLREPPPPPTGSYTTLNKHKKIPFLHRVDMKN